MKRSGVCPKCSSQNIVRGARVGDREGQLMIWSFEDPTAIVFKGRVTTGLWAYVCGACGFVEFYSDKPGTLPSATKTVRAAPKPVAPKAAPPSSVPRKLPKPPPGKLPKRPQNPGK